MKANPPEAERLDLEAASQSPDRLIERRASERSTAHAAPSAQEIRRVKGAAGHVSTRRLRKGLDKLEGKARPGGHPGAPSGFAAEVREIDREIAELEAEIAAAEARMGPAELAASRAEWAAASQALEERMHGLTLEEQIAILQVEIEEAELLERLERGEGGSY